MAILVRVTGKIIKFFLLLALLFPFAPEAKGLTFKEANSKITEYKIWLDQVGANGARYWVRLDSTKRPHRLYLGDGFMRAAISDKEQFIEIFSHFLAGHPQKNMLIDLYDSVSGRRIGEYGFGGFKLY